MLEKKRLVTQAIKTHLKAIAGLKKDLLQPENQESVHDARVRIKKIRALWRLMNYPKKPKLPRKLKLFYTIAGKLRDIQILLNFFNDSKMQIPIASANIQGRIYWLQIWLKQAFLGLDCRKSANQMSGKNKAGKDSLPMIPFIIFRRQMLADIMVNLDKLTDDGFHQVRKILKDLQYLVQWQTDNQPEEAKAILEGFYQRLVEITDPLGKFQDTCNLIELTNKGFLENLPEVERNQLAAEKMALLKVKATIRKKLSSKLLAISGLMNDLKEALAFEASQD